MLNIKIEPASSPKVFDLITMAFIKSTEQFNKSKSEKTWSLIKVISKAYPK